MLASNHPAHRSLFVVAAITAFVSSTPALQGCGSPPGDHAASSEQAASACSSYQGAYGGSPWTVPGTIEAENYDLCGQGWAYYDTTPGNTGGAYRTDDVDIEATTDTGGGYDVGWTVSGEWLNYSSRVTTTGSYQVALRVASTASGQTMHFQVDGVDVGGAVSVPNTGGWQNWATVTTAPFSMTAGSHVLALSFDTGSYNVNWFDVQLAGGTACQSASNATCSTYLGSCSGTSWVVPGQIEAENYDLCEQYSGYYDTTPGNTGGAYRSDDVDIEATTDTGGGYDVGWIASGEWLNYSSNVATTGTYQVQIRVASPQSGQTLHFASDGVNLTGSLTVPNTGGWETWTTITSPPFTLTAGNHVLALGFDTGHYNVNWINIQPASGGGSGSTGSLHDKLLSFIDGISGSKTMAGEHQDESNRGDFIQAMYDAAGHYPALWGGDFLFESDQIANRPNMIAHLQQGYQGGAMISLMYHACPPTGPESCDWGPSSTGVLSALDDSQWADLTTDGGTLNGVWKSRLDAIAPYFQQLKDAGMSALFRPHHEMNQGAFWWGGRPGPTGTAKLYQITHDYLVNTKGLDNIVWVWSVQDIWDNTTNSWNFDAYNPGDSYWDVMSLDFYDGAGFTQDKYDAMLAEAGNKPIAIGECPFLPARSDIASQPRWVYFMGWAELVQQNMSNSAIAATYTAPNVLTQDLMPGW